MNRKIRHLDRSEHSERSGEISLIDEISRFRFASLEMTMLFPKILLTSIAQPDTEFLGDFFFLIVGKCIILRQSFGTDKATHRVAMCFSVIARKANQAVGFFDWIGGFGHEGIAMKKGFLVGFEDF